MRYSISERPCKLSIAVDTYMNFCPTTISYSQALLMFRLDPSLFQALGSWGGRKKQGRLSESVDAACRVLNAQYLQNLKIV